MAGMMWRRCVVLLVISTWQVCSAQELINLVEPHLSNSAPQPWPQNTQYWKMFDHDESTSARAMESLREPRTAEVSLTVQPPSWIPKPVSYRIIMPADVLSTDYPTAWKLTARKKGSSSDFTLAQVEGAVFNDGVYEGTLSDQIKITEFLFKFDVKRVSIAEIELLGPRENLDALWPYGAYPCSQRLEVITSKNGPKKIFSKPTPNATPQDNLRVVFNANEKWGAYIAFDFDGAKPIIIGAELPELPMVSEVSVDTIPALRRQGITKVVLQGSFCEPHCRRTGSKGWVRLAAVKASGNNPRIFVENPGMYKAYRLKFIPGPDAERLSINGISFLGCNA